MLELLYLESLALASLKDFSDLVARLARVGCLRGRLVFVSSCGPLPAALIILPPLFLVLLLILLPPLVLPVGPVLLRVLRPAVLGVPPIGLFGSPLVILVVLLPIILLPVFVILLPLVLLPAVVVLAPAVVVLAPVVTCVLFQLRNILRNFLIGLAHDVGNVLCFAFVAPFQQERVSFTRVFCAACSTDAMDIVFCPFGRIVVDHDGDVSHIQTARRQVCGYTNPRLAVLEFPERVVALLLVQIAVQLCCCHA
mmetsp:Transcript_57077/g.133511  ORF Transcript_57077/g.133511 Transcript_57077/m.133511 type:complete len:253 (-) Transcript_57077:977-1735(-)